MVGGCSVVASGLGRAIAPALPGTSSGIDGLISKLDQMSAFLTQFVVVMGVATAARLLLFALQYRLLIFRPVAVLSCAFVFPLVVTASSHRLGSGWLLAMLGSSAIVATAAAGPSLRNAHSRFAGLVLCVATAGSLVAATAKILGLNASRQAQASLFATARGVSSVGLALEILLLVVVTLWLVRRERRLAVGVAAIWALSAAAAWAGVHGEVAAPWRMFAGRALSSLTTHPDPYLGTGVRYTVEVASVLMAGLALTQNRTRGVGQAVAFALLAGASADVPVCGLMLVLSSLLAIRASQSWEMGSEKVMSVSPA